jgi:hypothetical protein
VNFMLAVTRLPSCAQAILRERRLRLPAGCPATPMESLSDSIVQLV